MAASSRKIRSFYVASPFREREAAREASERLKAMGHDVTSKWIDTHLSNNRESAEVYRHEAVEDFYDVERADGFVLLNLPGSSGGMFCEFGYALGLGKRVWIVSAEPLKMPTCLFFYLPNVTVVPSIWDVCLDPQVREEGMIV